MAKFALDNICSGGCSAKLGPEFLARIIDKIPKYPNSNLLVGFDSSDDGAVYKINDDFALVQTLDFFTPMVSDPYVFGKIAAANALSDVYAMGGEVLVALNIVCFPEKEDPNILMEILRGGAEKVFEAGGVTCGGHSINDHDIKYGLSVTGKVNPNNILANNGCKIGDKLILTKPLGVGIVMAAQKVGEASEEAYNHAIKSMEALNKYAALIMKKYRVNACTDVTGFGFLGHLNEMSTDEYTLDINASNISFITGAYELAEEFILTSAGQRNRNYLKGKVKADNLTFAVEELLYDPQTSGGLIISVDNNDAMSLLAELNQKDIKATIVGEVVKRHDDNIVVREEA